jgi:hypothetical protein
MLLLSDQQVQAFVVDGFLYLPPSTDIPSLLHDTIHRKTTELFSRSGDPGNNLLPLVPELASIIESAPLRGALTSLLGPDYCLHPHRRAHESLPGRQTQTWHKDTYKGRQYRCDHQPWWIMAMYYPQETTLELGPTEILPGSQYFHTIPNALLEPQLTAWESQRTSLCCSKGSIVLIHYDIWHRALENSSRSSSTVRWMHKLQFMRMRAPFAPSWNHQTNLKWNPLNLVDPSPDDVALRWLDPPRDTDADDQYTMVLLEQVLGKASNDITALDGETLKWVEKAALKVAMSEVSNKSTESLKKMCS